MHSLVAINILWNQINQYVHRNILHAKKLYSTSSQLMLAVALTNLCVMLHLSDTVSNLPLSNTANSMKVKQDSRVW